MALVAFTLMNNKKQSIIGVQMILLCPQEINLLLTQSAVL